MIFDVLSLNSYNLAFQSDSSGFVAIIGYMIVVFGFLCDEFIFEAFITGYDLAGAIMILLVTITVTIYKLK